MSDQRDRIGRGNPPKKSQFKKGQSGNPSERPKGHGKPQTLMMNQLLHPMTITESGKPVQSTRLEALFRSLINEGLRGNIKVAMAILEFALQLQAPETSEDEAGPLTGSDQEILANYIQRQGAAS